MDEQFQQHDMNHQQENEAAAEIGKKPASLSNDPTNSAKNGGVRHSDGGPLAGRRRFDS
jgi:hypothetical protein